MEKTRRQALLAWLSVGLLAGLCGLLAVLQYRWIGEVSRAERERRLDDLRDALYRLSWEFNVEVNAACWALAPDAEEEERMGREAAYAERFNRWKATRRHDRLFRRIGIATPENGAVSLQVLDQNQGLFSGAEWPTEWNSLRERLLLRLQQRTFGPFTQDEIALIEAPRFGPARTGGGPPGPGRSERDWLIAELNLDYLRETLFPELLQRHLGEGGSQGYRAEVVMRARPSTVILSLQAAGQPRIGADADASVTLLEMFYGPAARRSILEDARALENGERLMKTIADSGRGRWQLLVRNKAMSLEAIVSRTRWRNLGVSGAILVLMLATLAALVRFTRQAQKLAELQMTFVAGVSHELRTPLAVISTAAYNLRGRTASDSSRVEKYGALIQQEAEKLTAIVEQVLRFAGSKAGRVIHRREPLSIESVIEDGVQSSRAVLDGSHCVLEKWIDASLPVILGDALALKQAIQNLIHNAVKYGSEGNNWIGLFASGVEDKSGRYVEIRVADRGPGIPADEQAQIFDPFFRGRRAVQDQIHGTGLGLNLVKQIVEAHGGTIRVRSEPMKGSEFVVRIPAAPREYQDEFAHSFDRG